MQYKLHLGLGGRTVDIPEVVVGEIRASLTLLPGYEPSSALSRAGRRLS
jgi:hypothetical protein